MTTPPPDDELRLLLWQKHMNPDAIRQAEPTLWQEWCQLIALVGTESFVAQKKFLLNPLRRRYPRPATGETPSA